MRSIHLSRFIPQPRAVRWDYRNGRHYWLTQWRTWIFSAVVLLIALIDITDGIPLDHQWWLWGLLLASGLLGTFLPLLTWHRWIGPIIAERNARGAEVRTQLTEIEQRLTDETLPPWERRKLELIREERADELALVTAPRTMIPRPSR